MRNLVCSVALVGLICSALLVITPIHAEVMDVIDTAAAGVQQSYIPEFLPALSIFGDATQKLLDIARSGIEAANLWPQDDSEPSGSKNHPKEPTTNQRTGSTSKSHTKPKPPKGQGDTIRPLAEGAGKQTKPGGFCRVVRPSGKPRCDNERDGMSRRLLDQIEAVILFIGIRIGEGVESMQKSMMNIFSHVPKGIPFIASLSKRYPFLQMIYSFLRKATVSSLIQRIAPEHFYFDPLLRLIGFGPSGIVRGSIAAWVQGCFFGHGIPRGSWFSFLQKAGANAGILKISGKAVIMMMIEVVKFLRYLMGV